METLLIQWLTILVLVLLISALFKLNSAAGKVKDHILPNVTDTVNSVNRSANKFEDDILPEVAEATSTIKWLIGGAGALVVAYFLKDKFK